MRAVLGWAFQRGNLLRCAAALTAIWTVCPFRLGVAVGHSMSPTIPDGGLYLLDTHYYATHPLRRGDIAVFNRAGRTYIKRIVATAGNRIWLLRQRGDSDAEILAPQMVPQVRRLALRSPFKNVWRIQQCVIPPGECFVVGDNLEASQDSRSFGPISAASLRGRVILTPALSTGATRVAGRAMPFAGI